MRHRLRNFIKFTALIAALLGVSMVLTAGIGSNVKFKNVNKPFIDLEAAVQDLDPGHGGNEDTGIDDTGEIRIDSEEKTVETVEVFIEIREKEIRLNGIVTAEENFGKVFDAVYRDGMNVILVDDYAEYYTFDKIRKILEDKGIKVTEKVN